ncbi:Ppx/GppA phosphatase [Alkaliphilus metalliredigens QYMF]|uniref:Ppx/GppA phosphatase n=1 Tax=Alkaliphilus metalliredigens (strain QYMF) TaxID=293826 RepID=A6TM97_ALKMQ|nr:Ppx/GppA phosphatase family protein [Alkaliphilus metalliredigens]ABR47315.1 Ppx/GppA phosphatase [Alkaliphilus metalliredigens QYMF]
MNIKAIIDVGTNSIKFHIAELTSNGKIKTILDENNIARIGEGLRETGVLSPEAMKRNTEAITEFVNKAKELNVDEFIGVGTMALRTAKNSDEFVKMVKDANGVEIKVITGDEEARLSYLAVLSGLDLQEGELAIFDTGGGSTEFIFGSGKEISKKFSVNLGSLTISENVLKTDPATEEEISKALEEIHKTFEAHGASGKVTQLVGMGGTVTSIGAVKHKMSKYDPDIIQGSKLELSEVEEQIKMYGSKTNEERQQIVGLQPKRAEVILAGACILKVIMERMSMDHLTISDRGLRHGLAYDLFK